MNVFQKIIEFETKSFKKFALLQNFAPKKKVAPYMHLDIWIAHFCKNFILFIHLKYISLVSSWNYTMVLLSSYEMLQINVFVCIINFWLFLCCNLQSITSIKRLHVYSNDNYSSFIKVGLGTIVLDSISYSSSLSLRQFQTWMYLAHSQVKRGMWKGVFSNQGLQIIFSNTIFMKRFLYLLHQFACHFFSIERKIK